MNRSSCTDCSLCEGWLVADFVFDFCFFQGEDGGGGKGRLGTVSALMSKLWQLRLRRRNLEFFSFWLVAEDEAERLFGAT